MKTIKLNEGQMSILQKLLESEAAPDFEDGDIKEFGNPSENGVTATVHDDEGNPKYGKMPLGNKISKMMSPQNYWINTYNGGVKGPMI